MLDNVERILALLPQKPQMVAPYKQTAYRSVHLRRFPYRVFYLELDAQLWMLALAHDRRRPDYWARRKIP